MPAGAACVEALTRDAHAHAHFGATPQVYTSRAPLLRAAECAAAIRAAEGWAATTGGWSTSRHFEVPTTDVPLRHLTSLLPSLNRALRDVLLPAAAAAYYSAATAGAAATAGTAAAASPAVSERGDGMVLPPARRA